MGSENVEGFTDGAIYIFNLSSFKPYGFMLDSSVYLSKGEDIQGENNIAMPTGIVSQGNACHDSARITIIDALSSPNSN